jgi:dihydroorotate dehydrogenase (NAD+) catalytic subunit
MNRRSLETEIGAVTLRNPVLLASGPAGYGLEYEGLVDLERIGGVVTKTISFEPREGNPGIRLHETGGGLLNSIGLENVGAEVFFSEKIPALVDAGIKPVVSLAAEDWEDYRMLLDATAGTDGVDIIELNLSCPNVERGGMAIGTNPELLAKYVRLAKDTLPDMTVLAKLTPNVGDIAVLALAAEEAGADGITAINTVVGMDIDLAAGRPVFKRIRAGLSGPAIMPIALDAVWRISRTVDIPVVGVGGITSVADAMKFFMAGATAIQVGTAVFYDPALPEKIVKALEETGIPGPLGE